MPPASPLHRTDSESLSGLSDEALVALIAEGDRRAYGLLVDRHLERTVAVARRIVGSQAEAEDVAQEAFLRLWQHAERFRPEAARFSTWFYRITMNLCLDRRRRPQPLELDAAGDPADEADDPAEVLVKRRTMAAVAGAVEQLPERLRAAVGLTYAAGLSNADAAASMNISVKALETLLVRARKALRLALVQWRDHGVEPATPAQALASALAPGVNSTDNRLTPRNGGPG